MTGEKKMFTSCDMIENPTERIAFGGNGGGTVVGLGKIAISINHSISDVYLFESLYYNLLSVSQLCEMGYNCLFTNEGVTVFRRGDDSIAFEGELKGRLYLVDFSSDKARIDTCLLAKSSLSWLWHRRLTHVGMNNLNKLLKGEHILGLTNVHFERNRICSACQARKQVGVPHLAKNMLTTTRPLELLHMDIFGPVAYVSIGGNKYGFVIVDDYSRYTWVFFMKGKSKVHEIFKKFATRAQNEFDVEIKRVRSDNGTEFKNTNIEEYLDEEGIGHKLSVPYTPQQNGIVERKNRTLIEAARTMLDEYKTLDSFWAKAINTACHAINRLYLHKLRHKTAYELLTGKKPNVSYFRVFGCNCFILNKKLKSSKFASKVDEGIFLGYASNAHGYRVFNKTTGCVEVTCDLTFDESNGSQVEQVDELCVDKDVPAEKAIRKIAIEEVKPQEEDEEDCEIEETTILPPAANPGVSGEKSGDSGFSGNSGEKSGDSRPAADTSLGSQEIDLIQQEVSDPHPRVRQSVQRDHPVDNILGSIRRGVTTRSRLANFCEHYSFVSMLEPLRVEDALGDADWVMVMQEELNNFIRNEVWSLVERPKKNVIGTKWVFYNKQDEDGVVTKNKARLVAKGYTQVEGLDFGETYTPVADLKQFAYF
jgi:transposase InsO family protein